MLIKACIYYLLKKNFNYVAIIDSKIEGRLLFLLPPVAPPHGADNFQHFFVHLAC